MEPLGLQPGDLWPAILRQTEHPTAELSVLPTLATPRKLSVRDSTSWLSLFAFGRAALGRGLGKFRKTLESRQG
jgi:hypothetical protein